LGAGAVALAGGGVGGGSGSGGSGSGGAGGATQPTNNAATISSEPGKDGGSVTTVAQKATGKFSVQDADAGQAGMQAQNNVAGKYGTFNLSADGTWGYELNPSLVAFKALPKDVIGKDSFTVKSLDGSAEKTVIVDVKGINDAPVITSTAQSGTVQEDGTLSATGQVLATDVDANTVMTYTGSKAGDYGSFKVATDGKWIYELNNAVVQNFAADKKVTETFTVTATDDQGVAVTQEVVIMIKGSNDVPIVSGTNTANIEETNSPVQVQGLFSINDTDTGESGFQTQTVNGLYGSLSVVNTGKWTYTAKEAFDSLNEKDKLVDSLSLKTIDGTTQALTITIQGTNDNPTVTAALTSKTNEGDAAYLLDLLQGAKDVDTGDLAGLSVVSGSLTYTDKTLSVNAPQGLKLNGNSLSIDPSDSIFDSLAAGVSKSIEINYNIRDLPGGVVSQKATVIITGTNDAPQIVDITPTAASRVIQEKSGVTNDTTLHILKGTFKVTDPDAVNLQNHTVRLAESNSSNLGTFEIPSFDTTTGLGNWTYTIQDSKLDKLAAGNNVTISNKFSVYDGVSSAESSIDVLLLGADTTSL
jgi:VCBS repeat-containing protein